MNLIEAIKSGKRFRRQGARGWIEPAVPLAGGKFETDVGSYTLGTNDILADDWDIEEKKAEISRRDIERMVEKMFSNRCRMAGVWKFALETDLTVADAICHWLGIP